MGNTWQFTVISGAVRTSIYSSFSSGSMRAQNIWSWYSSRRPGFTASVHSRPDSIPWFQPCSQPVHCIARLGKSMVKLWSPISRMVSILMSTRTGTACTPWSEGGHVEGKKRQAGKDWNLLVRIDSVCISSVIITSQYLCCQICSALCLTTFLFVETPDA